MRGGFDRKPGATSLVQEGSEAASGPGPGKRTLTERLPGDGAQELARRIALPPSAQAPNDEATIDHHDRHGAHDHGDHDHGDHDRPRLDTGGTAPAP